MSILSILTIFWKLIDRELIRSLKLTGSLMRGAVVLYRFQKWSIPRESLPVSDESESKMSLFKTKELWTFTNSEASNSENYTSRSLAFFPSENILASKFKTSLILTASVEGRLRLYHVVLQSVSNSEGLLLELDLKLPILQIEVGHFSSGGHGPHIAVLHPRQLSVYSLVKSNRSSLPLTLTVHKLAARWLS